MAFDFPSSPTVGQSYAPAGGPSYVWDGFAWAQANNLPEPIVGTFKISEGGATGAISTLDIPLPNGFKSLELHLYDNYPGSQTSFCARFSFDGGATFPAGTNYRWARQVVTDASTTAAAGHAAAGEMPIYAMNGTPVAGAAGYFKFVIPYSIVSVAGLWWSGYFYNASGYYRVDGAGRWWAGTMTPTHIRFFCLTGTFACAGGWQLNGVK